MKRFLTIFSGSMLVSIAAGAAVLAAQNPSVPNKVEAPVGSEVAPSSTLKPVVLDIRSGLTPDGRTYGPMPVLGEKSVSEDRAPLPDFIPVLSSDHQSIAGYAERKSLEMQRTDSAPVPVLALDFKTVVGYWHYATGFSDSPDDPGTARPILVGEEES